MPEWSLRPYQIADLGFHIAEKKSLNTSHPGTGKTPTVCVLAYYHWSKFGSKTIWTMPQSLMKQNKEKLLKCTDFLDEDIAILDSAHAALTKKWTGPTTQKQKRIKSLRVRIVDPKDTIFKRGSLTHYRALTQAGYNVGFAADNDEDHDLLVETLKGPSGELQYQKDATEDETVKDLIAASDAKVFISTFAFQRANWEHFLKIHPTTDLFLVDELHLGYKGPDSAQTKSFYHINNHVKNFCGMTGSLIDGTLESAFPAIHVIEPRYYGSHQGFLNQHAGFIDDYGRVQTWQNEEKLTSILDRHSVCHTFEECYGKEDVVFFHEKVEVGPLCRTEYDKFHDQAMLELENGEFLDGTLPGVATIRARQILAHPETMGLAKGEITGKDQRLAVFAAEGQKMLIFAALKPEQRRIQELLVNLGLRVGLINSDVGKPERNRIDLAFRAGQLDAIIASGPTAGVGYDWELADHVIYASVDYQDVNFIQAYRRASRGGRTTTLRVTSLEYENTIDRRQYDILTYKSQLANRVDATRPVLSFTG